MNSSVRERRTLAGRDVFPIGLGCMNLSHAYGVPPSPADARALLETALELGIEHFDTAALYGFGRNEELLGEVLAPVRKRIFLASKCGMTGVDGKRVIDGRPATLKHVDFWPLFLVLRERTYRRRAVAPDRVASGDRCRGLGAGNVRQRHEYETFFHADHAAGARLERGDGPWPRRPALTLPSPTHGQPT